MASAIKAVLAEVTPQRGVIQRIANEVGTSADILSNLANGRTRATAHPEVIAALRKRFKKPESWPLDGVSGPKSIQSEAEATMPYAGRISAGKKVDWTDPYDSEDWEYVPVSMMGKGRFCCRIEGDSMFDLLHPEDLCVFQSHPMPRLGLIVLHRSFDKTATIKQVKHDGSGFVLHPLNVAYDDVPAQGDFLGYLVGIVRKWGTREVTVFDPHGIIP